MRRTITVVVAVAAAVFGLAPAASAVRTMPGSFTGYAFDQCKTPSQAAMDAWLESSPYWGVGVYVAGDNRACSAQPNLTPTWVARQARRGWRILPITVGRQASCYKPHLDDVTRIDPTPDQAYVAARRQGRAEANATVAASEALGFARRTTHWLDIEAFNVSHTHCRRSMLAFVSGWTSRLHALGYRSGLYSSAGSGITAVEGARTLDPGAYDLPDQLWIAEWNNQVTVNTAYLAPDAWRDQRVHQYTGGHNETYAGVTINVDSNWMQVGGGSQAPRPRRHCRGVQVDFPTYGALRRGSKGARVTALQCLLREKRFYRGALTERYDRRTANAVERFQRHHAPLRVTGRTTKGTWVALHSEGPSPLMKVGSASEPVRRLQRALNAALRARLPVTGVYDRRTAKKVKAYQRNRGLPRTSVTTDVVWAQLHDGRI